jgi:hypothetical protein
MNLDKAEHHLMDRIPVPTCVDARASRKMRWSIDFEIENRQLYGYCAAKEERIDGFKLHLLETVQGVPVHDVLAPASHHDVAGAPELLETSRPNIVVGGDKGSIGLEKRWDVPPEMQLIIAKKKNQKEQNSKEDDFFLKKFRKMIETTNSQ